MAERITLDLDLIGDLARDLAALHTEFAYVSEAASDYRTGVGSTVVAGAIDEFADNWTIRRGRLLESIEAVATMAQAAHDGFTDTEIELANRVLAGR